MAKASLYYKRVRNKFCGYWKCVLLKPYWLECAGSGVTIRMNRAHPVGGFSTSGVIDSMVVKAIFLAWFSDNRVCLVHNLEDLSSSSRKDRRIFERI